MERTGYRPALVVVIGVLGFLATIAFNTQRAMVDARPERLSDLVGVVREMEHQRDGLEERLASLRGRMNELEQDAASDAGVRDAFTRELDEVREAAGLTAVRGPGIQVVLGDGSDVGLGDDPNDYLIHDTDISAVVNALLYAGAEAVDVNGERIVATTPIRCAGTTILVNASRLGSPYTVSAVGDPDALAEAVMNDPTASLLFTTYKNQFDLQVLLMRPSEVDVAAYRGSLRPTYLVPVESGDQG